MPLPQKESAFAGVRRSRDAKKIPAFFRKDHRIGNSPDARGGYEAAQETESNERLCEAIAEYCTVSNRNYVQSHFVFPEDYGSSGKGDVRVVELFAGVGGFRVGLERASARFKTIWANQWEPSTKRQDAFVCYADKFGAEAHCSNDDINSVPAANVPNAICWSEGSLARIILSPRR